MYPQPGRLEKTTGLHIRKLPGQSFTKKKRQTLQEAATRGALNSGNMRAQTKSIRLFAKVITAIG